MTGAGVVDAVFDAMPPAPRNRLLAMRTLILQAAQATGTAPLAETLKWGQPAFVPRKRDGTTIRLHWSKKRPDHCALLVHCQTDLIDRARQRFPTEFQYDGTRAVLVPCQGAYAEAALQQIAAMALCYHRDKRG